MEASDRECRPSPDALLEAAKREHRSRLKVFVGAAPGVGKTYAMLLAARQRSADGCDVAVGVVETHGRAETAALLDGLDVLPRRPVAYRGQTLDEMDIDALLARRPQLAVVDELAHTNAPGSRHPKRWQDVVELLDAGIDVFTTVNIQHLESLNDVVAQITGIRVRETIPDRVLDRADEVKLIDLSPEELIARLQEGKVYLPQQAERALRNWFQPANLTALRELALRETAQIVDEQMQVHRRAQAAEQRRAVAERLLVAVNERALSERLVRAARRLAERRAVPWSALFVEPARFHHRPEADRARVARVLKLAEELGGESVTIPGNDVAEDIVRWARERGVTEILLGKPTRARWREWWSSSTVDAVIRRSGDIDVRVVTGAATGSATASGAVVAATPRGRDVRGYAGATLAVAGAGVLAAILTATLPLDDPGLIFLAAVLTTAIGFGLRPAIWAAVLGVLVYDFFFVTPIFTLTVTSPQDVLSLVVFLLVAVLTSELTARVRDQAEAARRRETRTAALLELARAISGSSGLGDLLRVIVDHVGTVLHAPVAVYLPEAGRLQVRATSPVDAVVPEAERGTATWVWERNQPAGRGTDTLPGGEWMHVPLGTRRGAVGVLAVHVGDTVLALGQRQLLDAFARQAAVALERTRVDVTEAILESVEDGLVVLDETGVVLHVNQVASAILGFERVQALGAPFAELGTDHPHYLRLRTVVADVLAHPEREPHPIELALFLRGRDHFYVLRPTPLRDRDGGVVGLILVLQDVTYLRDQEARREQLMATLSHELRTPITSLRMAIDLLRRDGTPLGEAERGVVAAAHEDVERLEDVAQRLLDVSRSRAMSIALDRQRVPLDGVADRVVRIFALQARERGVTLAVEADHTDVHVAGDSTKLTWALSNLVANALRYTPRGGRVTVSVHPDGDRVRAVVADTGPGIPPDQQDRIFDRFVQGAPDAGEPGAAGLGLAIVRDIVQAHGGRIHLESAPGKGSRFTLDLPRR